MRQPTLTQELTDRFTEDLDTVCRVEAQETGDVNNPSWSTVAGAVACMVQQLSAEQRVAEAPDYEQRPTHQAFCLDADALQIGYRLVATQQRDQYGTLQALAGGTYLILGKDAIAGGTGQVRLALTQTSPVT